MEDKEKVVFTIEQFDEAVKKALDEFNAIGMDKERDPDEAADMKMANLIMGMQNAIFAGLVKKQLIGEIKEDK